LSISGLIIERERCNLAILWLLEAYSAEHATTTTVIRVHSH